MVLALAATGLGRTLQPLGGKVNVLQILEVFEDRWTLSGPNPRPANF
jgi:hypothetical protein